MSPTKPSPEHCVSGTTNAPKLAAAAKNRTPSLFTMKEPHFSLRIPAQNGGGQIIRLDPALDALISPGAKIEKLANGFGFTEGPVWVHSGGLPYLIFSDIPANVINKWTPDGKVSVFLEKSGFSGFDPGDAGYQFNNGHTSVT